MKDFTVKKVYTLLDNLYSYQKREEPLKSLIDSITTDDVIIYGLLLDEIRSVKYFITNNESGEIEKTEDNEEYYDKYIRLQEMVEKYGNKLV